MLGKDEVRIFLISTTENILKKYQFNIFFQAKQTQKHIQPKILYSSVLVFSFYKRDNHNS